MNIVQQPPVIETSFRQAGAIALNTILLQIDCSRVRYLRWQCVSMGTAGVVTPEISLDGSTWGACTFLTPAGNTQATFNGPAIWHMPVFAKFFRMRLSTATTGGTTTIALTADSVASGLLPLQTVQGTLTANLNAGTNLVGDVGLQVRANATGAASRSHTVAAASTNAANVKAAAGRVYGWSFANLTASWRFVKLHDTAGTPTAGAGVFMTIPIPPNGVAEQSFPMGIAFATGIGSTIVTGAADADATAVAANDVVGELIFA